MGTVTDFLRDIDFIGFIYSLQQGGWFDFVFPFMLVYAIVFTILKNVNVFSGNKAVKIIIALVFAFFSIAYPITDETYCGVGLSGQGLVSGCTVGTLMMTLFPGVSAFSMGILGLYIVLSLLGININELLFNVRGKNIMIKYILAGLGFIVVLYYYAKGFGWLGVDDSDFDFITDILSDPGLYILVIFGIFFYWITKEENENEGGNEDNKNGNKNGNVVSGGGN